MTMDHPTRLRRLSFRAWHRGTREADYLMGGLFDRYGATWSNDELDWFERLIEEQDVDILAWAFNQAEPPAHIAGPLVEVMRRLDYIEIPR
jgi:antitoxin CptB